jgi:hypothetical protein
MAITCYCLACKDAASCTDGAHCSRCGVKTVLCFQVKNAGLEYFCVDCELRFLCATGADYDIIVQAGKSKIAPIVWGNHRSYW